MSVKINVLTIGLDTATSNFVADILKDVDVSTLPMDMEQILEDPAVPPHVILVGPPDASISPIELAQSLRIQYQNIPIYLCFKNKAGFERKSFIKNGFTDAFLIPVETAAFRIALSETFAKASSGAIRVFRPVKIMDVDPGEVLDFDTSVYMPANKKYIKVSHAGDPLDSARVEKLKKGKMTNIYVPVEQMKQFYDYSGKRLKTLNTDSGMSATERKEKLTEAVREIVSGIFSEQTASFESGQEMMKDCGEIVKSFIVQGADNEWYLRILNVLGEKGDAYSHAGNVSTLAALFSMGLGVGKPEDLALAGMLHDIGIAELPPEIQSLEVENMNPMQLAEYQKHPLLSVNLIRSRKIVVPEIVTKAILQHHELYNGQGYPYGLFGDRICKEAQVLALANQFDYLTSMKEGTPLKTPAQAVEIIRSEQVNDPSRIHYNPELIKKLLTLFPAQI